MLQNIAWTWAVIGLAAALVLSGCDNGKNGTPDGDDADDAADLDMQTEDAPPPDTQDEDVPSADTQDEDSTAPDVLEEDMSGEDVTGEDIVEEEGLGEETTVVGRVWNYYNSGLTIEYDYPYDQVTVSAYTAEVDPVASALTDLESCTPWDPPEPYTCGYYEILLPERLGTMLKATDNYGFKDTLTRIFRVEPDTVQIIVMASSGLLDLISTSWDVTLDPGKGFVVGIVAVAGSDVHDAPFTELIGGASVEIEPSGGFGDDYKLVYHDADDPMNTGLEATDPDSGVFIAVNVPPRSFDDPYTITVSHESLDFEQVDFAVQADVLTYLILSP